MSIKINLTEKIYLYVFSESLDLNNHIHIHPYTHTYRSLEHVLLVPSAKLRKYFVSQCREYVVICAVEIGSASMMLSCAVYHWAWQMKTSYRTTEKILVSPDFFLKLFGLVSDNIRRVHIIIPLSLSLNWYLSISL